MSRNIPLNIRKTIASGWLWLLGMLFWSFALPANAGIVYSIDRTIGLNSVGGDGRVVGTIHTDGTQGVLHAENIYDFDLLFSARGTEVVARGRCGDQQILCVVLGERLSASSSFLLFDFSPGIGAGAVRFSGGDSGGLGDFGIWELTGTDSQSFELVDARSSSAITFRNAAIRDHLAIVGFSIPEPTSMILTGLALLALLAVGASRGRKVVAVEKA